MVMKLLLFMTFEEKSTRSQNSQYDLRYLLEKRFSQLIHKAIYVIFSLLIKKFQSHLLRFS